MTQTLFRTGPLPPLNALRRIREAQFMTQQELAEKSGVSRVTIVRLETQGEDARFSTIKKLAAALDVPPADLVGRAE